MRNRARVLKSLLTSQTLALMLREIDELTGELKRPIESTRRTIHVELNCQIEKVIQAFLIDLFASRVLREKQTQRKHVGHLGVVHFHVWSKLASWFLRRETVDHVVRLRAVGNDTLSVEKVAPLHDHLGDATIVRERPIVKERIEQQRHHPGRSRSGKRRFIRIVQLPVLAQRSIWRVTVGRLLLVFVISVNTLARLGPILLLARHFPTVQDSEQSVALMSQRPEVSAAFGIDAELNRLE